MSKAIAILEVDNPHFTVRLFENLLRVDLKGSLRNEVQEALENKPILKETVGKILGIFAPLHIRLSDIDSVQVIQTGKIKIVLSHRRNIVIPLELKDAERLSDKLNELIPKAKREEWERIIRKRTLMRKRARQHARVKRGPSSYTTMPWYFPTEQIDNVPKLKHKKKRKRRM
jgi:hypothetical protein